MTNQYYNASGTPGFGLKGSSASQRNEFSSIAEGFSMLPPPSVVRDGISYLSVTTGSADAYIATISSSITSYTNGLTITLPIIATNTGPSTVNVNSLGVKPIKRGDGADLTAGDLAVNQNAVIQYNATTGFFYYRGPSFSDASASAIEAAVAAMVHPIFTTSGDQGTAGQIPYSQGAGLPPVYGDIEIPPPGWNLLSTVTASASATVDIETTFDATYDDYVILSGNVLPSSNEAYLEMLLKIGGTYQSNNYVTVNGQIGSAVNVINSEIGTVASPFTSLRLMLGVAGSTSVAGNEASFSIKISNPSSTTSKKSVEWDGSWIWGANNYAQWRAIGSGRYDNSTAALTGVRFKFNTGNIATGTFRLYGIKKA